MSSTLWLAMYPGDFFGSWKVGSMPAACRGIYALLLLRIWQTDWRYRFPADDGEICDAIGLDMEEWLKYKAKIIRCFDIEDGFIVNERLKKEFDKMTANVKAAKKGAEKRWKKDPCHRHADGMPPGMPKACSPPPPPPKKKKTVKEKKVEYGEEAWGFEKDPEKKKYLDMVYLTDSEWSKLHQRYGPLAHRILEILDNWKKNKDAKTGHYKSDYAAINTWVASRALEEAQKQKGGGGRGMTQQPTAPRNQEKDVPHHGPPCSKCEKTGVETVEHRGQQLCQECLRIVAPEIPGQISALLKQAFKGVD